MEWFSQNWVWVLFAAGMIAMHLFGHGGHGGHGGHRGHGGQPDGNNAPEPTNKEIEDRKPEPKPIHRH